MIFEILVIGGGPAGMAAALVAARACWKTIIIDDGKPRNSKSSKLFNYLSRDGIQPYEFLKLSRAELSKYEVEVLNDYVIEAKPYSPSLDASGKQKSLFEINTKNGRTLFSRKIIMATGVVDVLPAIEGFESFYGKGIHHCPYCDGYEYRNKRLLALGCGDAAINLALSLRSWSKTVFACSRASEISEENSSLAANNEIKIIPNDVIAFRGDTKLRQVILDNERQIDCDAVFFNTEQVARSHLGKTLGCEFEKDLKIKTEAKQRSTISGVYVVGDACAEGVQLVAVAAGEGTIAAIAASRELQEENRR